MRSAIPDADRDKRAEELALPPFESDDPNHVAFVKALVSAWSDSDRHALVKALSDPDEKSPDSRHQFIESLNESEKSKSVDVLVSLDELKGRFFLVDAKDEKTHRAVIVKAIEDHQDKVTNGPAHVKFRCSVNDDKCEEILSCAKVMKYMAREDGSDSV